MKQEEQSWVRTVGSGPAGALESLVPRPLLGTEGTKALLAIPHEDACSGGPSTRSSGHMFLLNPVVADFPNSSRMNLPRERTSLLSETL